MIFAIALYAMCQLSDFLFLCTTSSFVRNLCKYYCQHSSWIHFLVTDLKKNIIKTDTIKQTNCASFFQPVAQNAYKNYFNQPYCKTEGAFIWNEKLF